MTNIIPRPIAALVRSTAASLVRPSLSLLRSLDPSLVRVSPSIINAQIPISRADFQGGLLLNLYTEI